MLRMTNFTRVATGTARLPSAAFPPLTSVAGLLAGVPRVDLSEVRNPLRAVVVQPDGKKTSVAEIVAKLHSTLDAARSAHGSDRGVISAPMLGYEGRIVVVHSGFDRRALINPKIVQRSMQVAHTWERCPADESVYRVARHRSVTVHFVTEEGDEETWYAMPLEESQVLQAQIDAFDGVSLLDRVSPCVAEQPEDYPEAVDQGIVGVVKSSVFDAYAAELTKLVEPIARHKVIVPVAESAKRAA